MAGKLGYDILDAEQLKQDSRDRSVWTSQLGWASQERTVRTGLLRLDSPAEETLRGGGLEIKSLRMIGIL